MDKSEAGRAQAEQNAARKAAALKQLEVRLGELSSEKDVRRSVLGPRPCRRQWNSFRTHGVLQMAKSWLFGACVQCVEDAASQSVNRVTELEQQLAKLHHNYTQQLHELHREHARSTPSQLSAHDFSGVGTCVPAIDSDKL